MSIQILSDLHLEAPVAYDIFEIVPAAPYLALLGDIGTVKKHKADFLAFLTRQLAQFRAVLFVPGNHEAYGSSWDEALETLREFEQHVRKDASVGDFILLDREVFWLPGTDTAVLGCSLFSFVPPQSEMAVSFGLQDFFQTEGGWDVGKHNEAHKRDLAWLNAQVSDLEKKKDVKVIIFSHWSPSTDPKSLDPRHIGSPITSGFSTDLSREKCFTSGNVKLWAFGHTHYNCDFEVTREGEAGPLRLLANQRGYYSAQAGAFHGEKTVLIWPIRWEMIILLQGVL